MMIDILNEASLLLRIARKETQALSELYDGYGTMAYSLAYHILRDASLAEEVVQDVFMVVWEKSGLYDPSKSKFSTWLGRITRNKAIDVLRRQRVRPEGTAVTWEDAWNFQDLSDANVEPKVIDHETKGALIDALNTLPDEHRRVLALSYFGGLSHGQIAEYIDEPLGTIKTRIRSAMQKMRDLLSDDG